MVFQVAAEEVLQGREGGREGGTEGEGREGGRQAGRLGRDVSKITTAAYLFVVIQREANQFPELLG